jgi:hypothetical protein
MTRPGERGVESSTERSEVGRFVTAPWPSLFCGAVPAGGATRETTGRPTALVGGVTAGLSALIPNLLSRVGSRSILFSRRELFRPLASFSETGMIDFPTGRESTIVRRSTAVTPFGA